MKTLRSNSGVTLVEVIVASTIVAITFLGVVTMNIEMQRQAKDSSNTYFVTYSAQTLINAFLQDAQLAVGSLDYPGIVIGDAPTGLMLPNGTGDANTTCFYQEPHGIPMNEYNNNTYLQPLDGNSVIAKWVCYTYPIAYPGGDVYRCESGFNKNDAPLYGMTSCGAGGLSTALGRAEVITPAYELDSSQNEAQKTLFRVRVKTCVDPAALDQDGNPRGCAAGDRDNPYVDKEGSISPSAQSAS